TTIHVTNVLCVVAVPTRPTSTGYTPGLSTPMLRGIDEPLRPNATAKSWWWSRWRDENGNVSRLRVAGNAAPLAASSKSVREVTECWIVSSTAAPGRAATAAWSRCRKRISPPCVGIHGGCETSSTPGRASGAGGAAVVVVVVGLCRARVVEVVAGVV